jgi:aerobic-type carbon monoxide dehydrogenase small subunit (CoxS/CutS family)
LTAVDRVRTRQICGFCTAGFLMLTTGAIEGAHDVV